MSEDNGTTASADRGNVATGDQSAELSSLIERLEKATWPDRKLDALILKTQPPYSDTSYVAEIDGWVVNGQTGKESPLYTASIDDALTLVDQADCTWKIFSDWPGDVYWAELDKDDGCPGKAHLIFRSNGCCSPAIALCIAALKARAANTAPGSPVVKPPSDEEAVVP